MSYIVAGLGNPGEEYENTRHNVGRMVVLQLAEKGDMSDWRDDKKLRAKVTQGVTTENAKIKLVLPDNYMNRSGGALAPLVKSKKQAEQLIVVHDDIDLPIGSLKIVFDRGSGGHRGVDSIVRALKTQAFIRVRVGVIPTTQTGKLKKPQGENTVHDFILKQLSRKDREVIDTVVLRAQDAVLAIIHNDITSAMQDFNGNVTK